MPTIVFVSPKGGAGKTTSALVLSEQLARSADVTLPDGSYRGLAEERRFASAVVERLQATPGVVHAGAVNLLPIGGSLLTGDFTVEGVTRPLPTPFIVLATQNPIEYEGTFPLPEAQLDRFVLRIHLGYPEPELRLLLSRQGLVVRERPVVARERLAGGTSLTPARAAVAFARTVLALMVVPLRRTPEGASGE